MPARPPTPAMPLPAPNWGEVEQLVEELTKLAQTEISLAHFGEALLERLLRALPASCGAVWANRGSSVELLTQTNFPAVLLATAQERWNASTSTPASITVDAGRLLVQMISIDSHPRLMIEALLPAAPKRDTESAERLLAVFGEIGGDYLRRQELRELRERETAQRGLGQLLLRLHANLDLHSTAYAIANDGRHWLKSGRVSVIDTRNKQAKVLAISGIDEVDPRADVVRQLASLSQAVAASDDPLIWAAGSEAELPPQVATALHEYLDHSHAARLYALPLRSQPTAPQERTTPSAVLVVEWFDDQSRGETSRRLSEELASHATLALGNALQHRLPLLPLFEALGKLRKQLRRRRVLVGALLGFAVAAIATLTFIQIDFTLEATGTLLPKTRMNLFAPHDGVVEQVLAQPGADVARGQELLHLRDRKLEFEIVRVRGELQTTAARLATIRAKRSSRPADEERRDDPRELAAEEEQLKQKQIGLEGQLSILETMQGDLKIVSPIDGQLLTWEARELLEARPVRRGQLLLTVADTAGAWVLDLRVADADVGHLLTAQKELGSELPVSFLLATDPSLTHSGTISEVAPTTNAVDGQTPTAQVKVLLADPIPGSRAGASVSARIDCGRRSIGYVWFHQLVDAVRSRILF